tara:strand:- start:160 stop:2061 length:1902 start_codon:yes stop_codon:yes gene_type:complete
MLTLLLQSNLPEAADIYVDHLDFARYVLPKRKETSLATSSISDSIEQQLPEFIPSDHPKFFSFIEAYYEWLEQKDNSYYITQNLRGLADIDDTIDEYVDFFKNQYLHKFPIELAQDASGNVVSTGTLLKNIKTFYESKGTEKSYKFLFRILYDVLVDFYYPKLDILKVSDGKWTEEKSIKITTTNGVDNFKMKEREIVQFDSFTVEEKARAKVSKIIQYSVGPLEVTELYLRNITGTFVSDMDIECALSDGTILKERVYNCLGSVSILNSGSGYEIGDSLDFQSGLTGSTGARGGWGGDVKVSKVDFNGAVVEARIDNFGINYNTPFESSFKSISGNGAARARVVPKPLNEYAGFYTGNNGKLSSSKKIQDGSYYQDFSYVIKAEMAIDKYRKVIKNLIHPAGLKMFGEVSILRKSEQDLPFHSEVQRFEIPLIAHYSAYTFGTTFDLRANGRTADASYMDPDGGYWLGASGDLYPLGYNPIVATGPDGTIFTVGLRGMTFATVPEGGYTSHYPGDYPLGTMGAGGALAGWSADINHQSGGGGSGPTGAQFYGYGFWDVYHHPNSRNLTDIPTGISFGGITLEKFIELPFGWHYHSSPGIAGDPYYGSPDSNYSTPHGTTYSNINETLGGFTW